MSSQEDIRTLIVQLAMSSPECYGSKLGHELRLLCPDVDMRRDYGGLRQFIEAFCADAVRWLRKRGGDDVYAHISYLVTPNTEDDGNVELAPTLSAVPADVWAAFTRPSSSLVLLVDRNTGVLSVGGEGQVFPINSLRVPRLTTEDYRAMCREFLGGLVGATSRQLSQALEIEDFWSAWSRLLKEPRHASAYREWIRFRYGRILKGFETKLREMDLAGEVVSGAVSRMKASHDAAVQPRLHERGSREAESAGRVSDWRVSPTRSPSIGNNQDQDMAVRGFDAASRTGQVANWNLRHLVINATENMSERELRSLWLPLGAIFDALRRG
jgi:hypothetical protein